MCDKRHERFGIIEFDNDFESSLCDKCDRYSEECCWEIRGVLEPIIRIESHYEWASRRDGNFKKPFYRRMMNLREKIIKRSVGRIEEFWKQVNWNPKYKRCREKVMSHYESDCEVVE